MLEKLGDERLVLLGKGTFVKGLATKDSADGSIKIALANFDPWGRNMENVPVSVLDLEDGNYIITTHYLSKAAQTQTQIVDGQVGPMKLVIPMGSQEVAIVEIKKQ
jgi:hypothetical protein